MQGVFRNRLSALQLMPDDQIGLADNKPAQMPQSCGHIQFGGIGSPEGVTQGGAGGVPSGRFNIIGKIDNLFDHRHPGAAGGMPADCIKHRRVGEGSKRGIGPNQRGRRCGVQEGRRAFFAIAYYYTRFFCHFQLFFKEIFFG